MAEPPFSIGVQVVVLTFGRKAGTVVAVARDGRYQVRVESITMWCRADDLAAPPAGPRKKKSVANQRPPAESDPSDTGGVVRIDLHGLRVEEAMARVLGAMDAALVRDASRMEIVHGKGEGRLKAALHKHLAGLSVVQSFRLDPHNAGVTVVYF